MRQAIQGTSASRFAAHALCIMLLLGWCWPLTSLHATAVPALHAHVNDDAQVLGDRAANIETKLAAHEQATGNQVVVLTVPDLGGQDIEGYANDVFAQWRLGHKGVDNGVLMVVAVKDRRARIEVGYGLEGQLTDLASSQILRNAMHPRFATGDYAGGVEAGVEGVLAVLSGAEPAPVPPKPATEGAPWWVSVFIFFMLTLFSLMAASGGGLLTLWVTPACSLFLFFLMPWPVALIIFLGFIGGVYGLRRRWMQKAFLKRKPSGKRRAASSVKAWPPSVWQVLLWNGAWTSGSSSRTGGGWSGDESSSSSSSSSSDYSGDDGSSGGGGASDSW
ncbi:TPM domain-containing protein [Dyella subtropica]|uniref:TPM domain-containing protein n=1 Tax=Dyella subtropica TaxID=2992127 RepID=UPI00224D4B2B|nr:TPM domain-containing protein [Dyella subtropica]